MTQLVPEQSRHLSVDPTSGRLAPSNPNQSARTQAFQTQASGRNPPQPPASGWTKALTVAGTFAGLALIVAAVIVPLYLVPLLTGTTTIITTKTTTSTTSTTITTITTTTTTTTATTTTTTDTTTTTTTTAVTLYIPSNYFSTCGFVCSNVTTVTPSTLLASWSFENNPSDSTNTYNGVVNNGATYVAGIVSQTLAINSAQYLTVSSPFASLANRSFTFEAWIYLTALNPSVDFGIFGQCQAASPSQCLHFIVRSSKLYLGFYADDVSGITTISANTWMHVAFTYDLTSNAKSLYLNGAIDGTTTGGTFYKGTSGVMYVGYATHAGSVTALPGNIDQAMLSNRAKTACEILNDATLVARFTFDNGITDSGPNNLPSYVRVQANNGMSYVTGRVNRALMFAATNAFFQSCGFNALGRSNQQFSFSLWIKPTVCAGTLIHLSSDRSGSGNWCLPKLGFSSSGALIAQSWQGSVVTVTGPMIPINNWTHIAQTWSSANGLRLYVNGGLYGASPMATFSTNTGVNMCLFLGTSGFGTNCQTSTIDMDSYSGAIDEFYVFNRELTQAEVCPLAHP